MTQAQTSTTKVWLLTNKRTVTTKTSTWIYSPKNALFIRRKKNNLTIRFLSKSVHVRFWPKIERIITSKRIAPITWNFVGDNIRMWPLLKSQRLFHYIHRSITMEKVMIYLPSRWEQAKYPIWGESKKITLSSRIGFYCGNLRLCIRVLEALVKKMNFLQSMRKTLIKNFYVVGLLGSP